MANRQFNLGNMEHLVETIRAQGKYLMRKVALRVNAQRAAPKTTKKKMMIGGALCLAVVGSVALLRSPSAGEAAPTVLAPLVSVAEAKMRDVIDRAAVTGTLVPFDEILVTPEIDGYRIVAVLVDEGARVEKGQVLARLSRDILDAQMTQLTAAIEQAKNQIIQAEAANIEAQQSLQRTMTLSRSGNSTEATLEQKQSLARAAEGRLNAARNGLVIAEAQRTELGVRLERTDIRAPEAGIVSRKIARIGAVASAASEPLFRIIALGRIELEADVTEYQLPRLHEGAPAIVTLDAGHKVEGQVRLVSPEVDRKTRLGKVRIAVPSESGLRIGAFAYATIELARKAAIAVPSTAVIYGVEGPSLQVVRDSRVVTRRVTVGLSGEGFVEVIGDVKDGDQIVARAGSFLQDGDAVRTVPAATAAVKEAR